VSWMAKLVSGYPQRGYEAIRARSRAPKWTPHRTTDELQEKIALLDDPESYVYANSTDRGLYTIDPPRDEPKLILADERGPFTEAPAWSPDGSRIAFVRGGELFTMQSDGCDVQKVSWRGVGPGRNDRLEPGRRTDRGGAVMAL
jgi:hypothetical protein